MWKEFVSMNSFDLFRNRVQNILDVLSKLFSDGRSYSQKNVASNALLSIITIDMIHCTKHRDA